jgi:hypothetical protein
MTETPAYTQQQEAEPLPDVKRLDRLVGTWKASDPTDEYGLAGTTTFEWMAGGFFLIQYVDLERDGHAIKGIEVIGHERLFGATEPSDEIKSRFYSNSGDTFDYVYELNGDTLTIWGGEVGSPAHFTGTFSRDGSTLSGGWVWPGGGYQARMTRVRS